MPPLTIPLIPRLHNGDFVLYKDVPRVWQELSTSLTAHNIVNPLCITEPFSGIDPLFVTTCYSQQIPSSLGTIYNLSFTAHFTKQIPHDCLVTTPQILTHITKHLEYENCQAIHTIILIGDSSVFIKPVFFENCTFVHLTHPLH